MNDMHAPVKRTSQDGFTPLLVAAFKGRLDAVRVLLELGVYKNAKNNVSAFPP